MKIQDFCEVFDGPHATPTKTADGPYYLSISSLDKGKLDLSKSARLSEHEYVRWTKRVTPRRGDLLFSYETRLGEAALMPDGIKACLGRRMGILRPDPKKVLPEFLLYSYLSPEFQGVIVSNTITGATVDRLSLTDLPSFRMRIPPLGDQQRIAAVLSALDAKIELNQRLNAELEGMAKLLYDYWFVQYDFPLSPAQAAALRQPHLAGKPYRSSGGPMVYHEHLKREIPKGWKVGDLEQLCSMVRGVTYSKADVRTPTDKNTVPILRATNVNNGIVDLSDLVYVTEDMPSEDQNLEKFDILVVMSSGSKTHVGKNALYCYDQKVAYGAFCSKVVPNASSRFFVAVHMQSDPFKKYISNVCRGTSINNLTNAHITKHQLPIPPQEQLQEFEKTVSSFFETIACNHQQNQELTTLRDWLLPMLMNGQVRVIG